MSADRLAEECFGTGEALTSWAPLALGPIVAGVVAGEIVGPVPGLMARTDGACLLYPGEVHSLAGEPETGKGWVVLGAVSSCLTDGESVLYLDFEDTPASIVGRLLALGTAPEAILARFDYVRPCDPFTPDALTALLDARQYALAVLDGLSEAYSLLGLDPYLNADAAKFLAALPRPIAERGAAVVEVDHVVKSKESRGRWAIGGQHKLAGVAAAYSTEVIKQPSRTDAGLVKLKVEKDRHGHVRSHAGAGIIALVRIVPSDEGERVYLTLDPPDASASEDGAFRPTVIMGRVARYVEDEPGATANGIRNGVKTKRDTVTLALRRLLDEGYIERRQEGQSFRHFSVHPFDENTAPQPRPNRAPGTVQPTAPTRPSPVGRGTGQGQHNGSADLANRAREINGMTDEQEQQRAWDDLKAEVG